MYICSSNSGRVNSPRSIDSNNNLALFKMMYICSIESGSTSLTSSNNTKTWRRKCWIHSNHVPTSLWPRWISEISNHWTNLFEEVPAGMGVAGIGWVLQSVHSILNHLPISRLEPHLVRSLRSLGSDFMQSLHGVQCLRIKRTGWLTRDVHH